MRLARAALGICLLLTVGFGFAPASGADARDAARQYRVARRLVAEDSPEAASALRRVVELDPAGELADDALVEQARLQHRVGWPEELGRAGLEATTAARELLDRAVRELPDGDRIREARYRRALARLEPLAGHDPAAARLDLLEVATAQPQDDWSRAARYALAWLGERQGDEMRAEASYQRLVVDAPHSVAATRARAGLARLALRDARPGDATIWLDRVIGTAEAAATAADALRRLSLAVLLEQAGTVRRPQATGAFTGIRTLTGFVTTPDGGIVVADRREGMVDALDEEGRSVASWRLESPQALAAGPGGTLYSAAGEAIYRLDPGGQAVAIASQGDYGPVSSLAADALGGLWLIDRRGERIGRIAPGASEPAVYREPGGSRLAELIWDGRRLLGVDTRGRRVVAVGAGGSEETVVGEGLLKPIGIASDPAGRIAVLDVKQASVLLFDAAGTPLRTWPLAPFEIERPGAIALGSDGSLHLFDESTGAWTRLR